jgi:hypothetical protein
MLVRSLGWLMVLAVGLTAVACNTKDGASGQTSTSTSPQLHMSSSTTLPVDPAAGQTTSTVPFSEEIGQVREELQKASGNLCAMVDATHQEWHVTPENPTEVREAIDLLVEMIHAMGTVAPASDSAVYKATADELRAEAEKAGYSTAWIQSRTSSDALNDEAFVKATSRLETKYQASCKPSTSSSG